MTPRRHALIAAALLIALAGVLSAQQPSSPSIETMMGAALHQQDVEGNLPSAAAAYQKVLVDPRASRAVQAKALVQMARINARLANHADARSQYERLLREFPEQVDVVAEARARIAALGKEGVTAPPHVTTEPTTRKVWSRNAPLWGVSADGRYLTFGHLNNAFIRDTRDGSERQLTRGGIFLAKEEPEYPNDVRFSKDDRQLTYGWKRATGYQLRVIAFDGTNERTITNNPEHDWIGPVDWSSDGTRMLVKINNRGNVGQIAWVSLASGAIQVLKTVPWTALGRIALSPDGRFIAFDQRNDDRPTTRSVFVLSADGSKQVALTDGSSRDDVMGWLPDGGGLAYVTYRNGSPALWLQPWGAGQASGAARMLRRDIGAIEPLGLTRDGSLFYRQTITNGHAYVASIDWDADRVVEPRVINANVVSDGGTAWSPDGSQVAYIAHRGTEVRRRFIAVHTVKDNTTRELSPPDDLLIQNTGGHKWSPDGKSFLVNGGSDQLSSTTFAIDVRSGAFRPLLKFTNAYAQIPQWLNGGRSLLTLVRDQLKPTADLFIFDLDSGNKLQVRHGFETMRSGGFLASPDERTIVFMVASDEPPNVLRLMPLSGGAPRTLVGVAPGLGLWPLAWSPDSRRIVYSRSDRSRNSAGGPRQPSEPQERTVWVVSADGGEPRRLLFPHAAPQSLDIHPDGRQITYSVSESEIEVWTTGRLSSTASAAR